MGNISLTVEKLEVTGWKLKLALRVEGEYNRTVRDPKVTVTFDSGTQTRRVPVVVRSYEHGEEHFQIQAKHVYDIRDIFFEEPLSRKIVFWFDVIYGENCPVKIPFIVDLNRNPLSLYEEQKNKKEPDEIDEKKDFNDSSEDEEQNENGTFYEISTQEDQGLITLNAVFKEKKITAFGKFCKGICIAFGKIWTCILFIIGLGLLPIFILDGFLAFIGAVPKRTQVQAGNVIVYALKHAKWRWSAFCRMDIGFFALKWACAKGVNKLYSLLPIRKNQIVFFSNRRMELSGNFEFVYDILKEDSSLDFRFVFDTNPSKKIKFTTLLRIGKYFANSKIILVDDYFEFLYKLPRRKGTYFFQLWHACGAFKTFGCSRMGKSGGQGLKSKNHRNYDVVTVSSQEIAKFYAEGFGLSLEKVRATGIPRTDIFFDEEYKKQVQEKFYQEYPKLKEKKILLFAPTFRGNGKNSGHYPVELFDVNRLYEELGEEYAIIIKHHPFVSNRNQIKKKYRDYIIDLSENSELNDLLFVTDVLITDYSSVVFEASLLEIPMLFYVYDLEEYVSDRGFYYEYETFVPGKIIYQFEEIAPSILKGDLEQEKLLPFQNRFFDDRDGKSSQRTVDVIYECMNS